MIEHLFVRTIGEERLLRSGQRVLAAVSGGGDSVALLRLLHRHAGRLGIGLVVAHVNHRLRGEASERDERFVADLAASLGLECDALAAPRGLRGEAALRSARHRLLKESAARARCDRIALGHTMDDQAETVLMRLMRGAGRRGLGGMRVAGPGPLVRPLLRMRRAALRGWLESIGQSCLEDESNLDPLYLRNRVRAEAMPVLEQLRGSAVPALARAAALLGEEDRFLDTLADAWLAAHAESVPPGEWHVPGEALGALDPALGRRVARLLLCRAGADAQGRSLAAVRSVLRLAESGRPGEERVLAGQVRAVRAGRLVCFGRVEAGAVVNGSRNLTRGYRVELPIPGRVRLPGAGAGRWIEARLVEGQLEEKAGGECVVHLDADRLGAAVVVRTRRPGDRFQPLGMSGRCRLKEFLIDRKVPRESRDDLPLVEGPHGIAWVVGLRAGEPYRVRGTTRRVARLVYEPSGSAACPPGEATI